MDKTLRFNSETLESVINEFNNLSNAIENISFEIWTEIPENYKISYYQNEQLINPVNESFEVWNNKLLRRPNPIYSVAISGNQVISSVYGAGLNFERTMNLWATNAAYRLRGIGKVVLLNFIKHCFENDPIEHIKAWDVTSAEVNNILTELGFV